MIVGVGGNRTRYPCGIYSKWFYGCRQSLRDVCRRGTALYMKRGGRHLMVRQVEWYRDNNFSLLPSQIYCLRRFLSCISQNVVLIYALD